MDGMGLLLKSLGVDPAKIVSDFTSLKDGVLETLKKMDERMAAIENRQEQIWTLLTTGQIQPSTQPQPQPQLALVPQKPATQMSAQ